MYIPDYFFRSDENRTDPEDPERSTKSAGFPVTKAALIFGAAAAGSLLAASFWTSGSVMERRRLVLEEDMEYTRDQEDEDGYTYPRVPRKWVKLYGKCSENDMLRQYTDDYGERLYLFKRGDIFNLRFSFPDNYDDWEGETNGADSYQRNFSNEGVWENFEEQQYLSGFYYREQGGDFKQLLLNGDSKIEFVEKKRKAEKGYVDQRGRRFG